MDADPLDYTRLVQRALTGVVRDALRVAAEDGLPGEHHFYLAFLTGAEGVELPQRLRSEYPNDMTIVIQHLFWDLAVDEEKFSVTLRFGGTPEHIVVPFSALTSFVDPAASFGLRFEPQPSPLPERPTRAGEAAPAVRRAPGPRPALKPKAAARPALAHAAPGRRAPRKRTPPPAVGAPTTTAPKVVDLAAFRRQSGEREEPGD